MSTEPIAAGPNDVKVMRHTPGPWKVASYVYYASQMAGAEFCVTAKKRGRIVKASRLADATLIAAAPELLAALQEVVAISDRKHDAWDTAKAAINKALGRAA